MSASICKPLALLIDIEKPRGSKVRHAGDGLHQVMDAVHDNRGFALDASVERSEDFGVLDQRALEHCRDFVSLGHDVKGDNSVPIGGVECRFELWKIRGVDDPGFVRQHIQPGFYASFHPVDLSSIAAGDHYRVSQTLPKHALEEVGAGMNL